MPPFSPMIDISRQSARRYRTQQGSALPRMCCTEAPSRGRQAVSPLTETEVSLKHNSGSCPIKLAKDIHLIVLQIRVLQQIMLHHTRSSRGSEKRVQQRERAKGLARAGALGGVLQELAAMPPFSAQTSISFDPHLQSDQSPLLRHRIVQCPDPSGQGG